MKYLTIFRNRHLILAILPSLLFVLAPTFLLCQAPPTHSQSKKEGIEKTSDPEYLRWKILLDALVQEAKTAFPEERRPYAMADVASAYWYVNKIDSKAQYLQALDKAISFFRNDKKYKASIDYVISSAARRDASLVKPLAKRLADEDEGRKNDLSNEAALDLLDENPEAAASIAESFAPNGLMDGSAMFLIFRIAERDPRLSDRVYNTYLNAVRANDSIPLEAIVTMAGYSFGYSEYFSVGRSGQLMGASLRPILGLRSNPVFNTAFLNIAYRSIRSAIERRNNAYGDDVISRNSPILFALLYLLPEVARFSPAALPAWQQLMDQGNIGVTTDQVQQIQGIVSQIDQIRARNKSFNDSSKTPEQEAEASLENVEKLPGTCQRDVVYSKAALLFGSRKNFVRAFEIAKNIDDLKQNEAVMQAILIGRAEAAIAKRDWPAVQETIEKISSLEHRAILYVKASSGKGAETADFILEAVKLTEKFPNSKDKAGVLFSISSLLFSSDWQESTKQMSSAIANLNKDDSKDEMNFSVPIRVPLSCDSADIWWGGFASLPNSNVFEAVDIHAKRLPDQLLHTVDEIGDKIVKIRASARVAGIALQSRLRSLKPSSGF